MMYQVLIADDESMIVDSLRDFIHWEKVGCQVAATASDGAQALEILCSRPIDIVLTDIRMPKLSGLELCKIISQKYPHIQTIVISGYAEFSYAQRAIKYGILGYCLKPLEYDEVASYVKQAAANLNREEPALSYDDFLDCVQAGDVERVTEFMRRLRLGADRYYVAASVGRRPPAVSRERGLCFHTGADCCTFVLLSPFSSEEELQFAEDPNNRCIGALSQPVQPAGLMAAIEDCQVMAYTFFIDRNCRISHDSQDKDVRQVFDELHRALARNSREGVISLLIRLKQDSVLSLFTVKTAMRLANRIISSSVFPLESDDYYLYDIQSMVSQYSSFENLLDTLRQLLDTPVDGRGDDNISNASFLSIVKYVNSHYREDLSLSQIAQVVHLNPNYVSQMFKKEMGVTLSKYLTELRISKAKELLDQDELPMSEIALKVGFNDYFYFLKTFKRVTGKTPGQYRERV